MSLDRLDEQPQVLRYWAGFFWQRIMGRTPRIPGAGTMACCKAVLLQHDERDQDVHLEIIWDDDNELHATQRATVTEITQAILDAKSYTKG